MQTFMRNLILSLMLISSINSLAQQLPDVEQRIIVSPNGLLDAVFDRFGTRYHLNDLRVGASQANLSAQSSALLCTSGYFNLYFEQGSGFDGNSTNDIARRNVICQLFSDLSSFINSPLSSPGNTTRVNIWVRNFYAVSSTTGGVLGIGSAFFNVPKQTTTPNFGGIADNEIWKTIISGKDSYTNVTHAMTAFGDMFYHGMIAFDTAFAWNTNLSLATASAGMHDLYTIALHEAMHAMGFMTLIDTTGGSRMNPANGYNYYSRYDLFLKNNAGTQNLITNSGACSMYNYRFNPSVPLTTINPNNCIGFSSPPDFTTCSTAVKYTGTVTLPVYRPNCFEPGSSLSHFEDQCYPSAAPYGNNLYYVMSNANQTGPAYTKRYPKPEERTVFCDIGYSVNSTYGSTANNNYFNYNTTTCPGQGVAGINDGVSSAGFFTLLGNASTAISFTGDTLLKNDFGAVSFECLEDVYSPSTISPTSGTTATAISFTSNVTGVHLLRYVPVAASGKRGNITYVFVYVGTANCSATSCNYVNNGSFESGVLCGPITDSASIDCWAPVGNTPDRMSRGCTTGQIFNIGTNTYFTQPPINTHNGIPNNNMIDLYYSDFTGFYESIETVLNTPLVPNGNYVISFWALSPFFPAEIGFAGISALAAPLVGTQPFSANPIATVLTPAQMIPAGSQWNYYTVPFTYTGTGNKPVFVIYAGNQNTTVPTETYLFLDDVTLSPVNVTLNLPSQLCSNLSLPNLNTYLTPTTTGGVFSGPGVSFSAGVYSFSSITAGQGTHTISYTFVNNVGCTLTISDQITVVPPITVTASASSGSVCQGSSSTLTATGATNYVWQPGLLTNNPITVTPAVTTTYTVTGTNAANCQSTATVLVNVRPKPTVTLSASPSAICVGQSTTLTAGGAVSYSVMPGSLTTPPFVVTPSATTTYTVTGTAVNGCTNTATRTVTVNPLPVITLNATQLNLCIGQTYTLNATVTGGPVTGSWRTNLTNPVCTNCLSTTITMSSNLTWAAFTATNTTTGCSRTDTVRFTVANPVLQPVLGPNANILCANVQYTIVSAPTGATYAWSHTSTPVSVSSSGASTSVYTVNWTQAAVTSGTVNCTVTAPGGCTATLTLPVTTSCCTSGSGPSVQLKNSNASTLATSILAACPTCTVATAAGTTTITRPAAATIQLSINGVFTINQNLTLVNFNDVRMGTNATIDIPANRTLAFNQCTTTVCDKMWDGIYINGTTARFISNTSTLLQQAKNAVVSQNGGRYTVSNTTFRNCVKGILVNTYTFNTHTGTVVSSRFDMPGTFITAVPALATWVQKTLAGIEINEVSSITIGSAANAASLNTFDGLYMGIYALSSGTTVYNATFTNLPVTSGTTNSGIGIRCEGVKNIPWAQRITVGGTAANQRCTFNTIMRRGVSVYFSHDVNITNNLITTIGDVNNAGNAIRIELCNGRTITIANNRISNQNALTGMNNAIGITDVPGSTVTITNNRLLQCNSTANGYAEQKGGGIVIQNTSAAAVNLTILNNDTIRRFQRGIDLVNVTNTSTQARVGINRILFDKPKANYTTLHYGVGLTNCTSVNVDTNTVTRTNTVNWLNTTDQAVSVNLRGVYVTNSSNDNIVGNTFIRIGEGIHANGACPNTFFLCNTLQNSYNAFMFSGTPGALLSDQLVISSIGYPTGNVFTTSVSSDLAGSIRSAANTLNPISWYYNGTVPTISLLQNNSLVNNAPTLSTNALQCSNPVFQLAAQSQTQRQQLAGAQMALASSPTADAMTTDMAKKDAHRLLLTRPDWLTLNTPDDATYQTFFTTVDNVDIGKTNRIEQAEQIGNAALANQLNTGLSTATMMLNYHKTVFDIYNRTWAVNNPVLTGTDTTTLLPIALLRPAVGGEAVYMARVMLDLHVDDATGNYSYRLADSESNTASSQNVKVYPNPASQSVTIAATFYETDQVVFTLYDLSGRLVLSQQLGGNTLLNIDLGGLESGTYLYQIQLNNTVIQTERLVIAK